jgi:hypothetical protein
MLKLGLIEAPFTCGLEVRHLQWKNCLAPSQQLCMCDGTCTIGLESLAYCTNNVFVGKVNFQPQ